MKNVGMDNAVKTTVWTAKYIPTAGGRRAYINEEPSRCDVLVDSSGLPSNMYMTEEEACVKYKNGLRAQCRMVLGVDPIPSSLLKRLKKYAMDLEINILLDAVKLSKNIVNE